MHRVVQQQIERALSTNGLGSYGSEFALTPEALAHLDHCEACKLQWAGMQADAVAMRQLRPLEEAEPRAGFYARVLERIEAEGPVSIWNLFMESPFGRRIATASLALVILLGVFLVSSERSADDPIVVSQIAVSAANHNGGPDALASADTPAAMPAAFSEQSFSQQENGNQMDQVFVESLPVSEVSVQHNSDDSVLSNLMTYREQ
jgi:hypothetical protein